MSLYTDASLIMFPSGYKEDKIYSLKPTDGSGDLTFTRASTATRVNADGLIETSPVNLAQYSEEFNNAAWVKTTDGQVTITANATTAPNGTATADKMIASAIAGFHCVAQTQSLVAGVFTISIYAKASEYSFLQIFDSLTTDFANFNLTTGAVATVDQYTATIESVGNGWYRCTATKTNPSGNFVFRYGIVTTGTATRGESFTGNGVNGLFIWGAQLNIGATAKPYFPTTDRLNVPRIDYTGGGCGKLLLEPQRTNLVTYSEQLDNAAWTKESGNSIVANNATSPDGTQNADSITATSGNAVNINQSLPSNASTSIYTFSIFLKKQSTSNVEIYLFQVVGGFKGRASINLDAGTITASVGTATITSYGNGWYRASVTGTLTGAIISTCGIFNESTTGTRNVYAYGCQAEIGSYVSSYIPTLASSVTRLADAASKTGISSLIGQTQGTIYLDFELQTTNQDMVIMNIYDAATPANSVYFYVTGTNILQAFVDNSGTQATISSGVLAQGRYKAALVYKANDFAFYVNGSLIGVDTSGTVPTCNALRLENYAAVPTYQEKMAVNQALLFPTRLTNTQLASLTTI